MQTSSRASRRPIVSLTLTALSLSFFASCGLGLDNEARLERAQAAYDGGEFRTAIIDTKNILQTEPQNREARVLLGRASMRINDAATADKELRRAMELGVDLGEVAVDLGRAMLALREFERLLEQIRPGLAYNEQDRLAILRLHGDALMALGSPAAAREAYEEVLAVDAEDLAAKLGVVSTYVSEEEYADARRSLDQAIAIDADYAPAWLASGSLHMTTKDADAAVEDFTRGLELAREQSEQNVEASALVGLTEARLARTDLEGARDALQQLRATAPESLSTRYLTARIAYLDEDYERAQAELQQVLSSAPNSRPAQFLMGAVHLKRGNLGQAEMHLSAVVAAQPNSNDARRLLAETRLQQNRADDAAEILRGVTGGADTATVNLAVRASLDAGEYGDAVAYLRQALAGDPGNNDLKLDLAAAHIAEGDPDAAEALLSSLPEDDFGSNAYRRALLGVMAPLRRGDTDTAMRDALVMAERWPDDVRVHNVLGGIALSAGELDEAREHFLAARAIDPSDTTSYVNVAAIELRRDNVDAARAQYQAAIDQQPQSANLMLALARIEARAENRDAAREWLEKARAADSTAIAPRLLLARHYLGQRAFSPAAEAAAEALALDNSNDQAHNMLGLAQQGLGEHEDALASFRHAASVAPEQQVYRLNQARAHASLGDHAAAEQALLGYGGIDLDDLQTSMMLAGIKVQEGDAETAMQIARDLQERHADNGIAFALEAELLAADQQYAEAAAAYDKALSLQPGDRRLVMRAFRVRTAGNLDNAVQPLIDYLEHRPLDTDTRLRLAQGYQSAGSTEEAIREYERILETAPDNFVALNNLGWTYFENGDERAEAIARRAFELSPQNGSVADTLGWIQVSNGNLEEGVPMLRKAVELSNGRPDIRFHLATGLAAAGEKAEAKKVLEEALASGDRFASREDAERLLASL